MCYICTVSVRLFSHKELRVDLTYGCSPFEQGNRLVEREFWMKFGAFHLLGALWTELSSLENGKHIFRLDSSVPFKMLRSFWKFSLKAKLPFTLKPQFPGFFG